MRTIIEQAAVSISKASRAKKYDAFMNTMAPKSSDSILDVGVHSVSYYEAENFFEQMYPYPEKITAVTIDDPIPLMEAYPTMRVLQEDGRCLPFADNEFDIYFSNAVIEHVGSRQDQERFLKHAFRVARRGFVTTPNRNFPVETHTRFPLIHYLPKEQFDACVRRLGKAWAAGDYMNLLNLRELRRLATDAGLRNWQARKNRLFGMPLTLTLTWAK